MDIIEYDKEQIQTTYPHCSNLKSLVAEIESDLWQSKDVIYKVALNGQWLNEELENTLGTTQSSHIDSLQIQVKPLLHLVQENLSALIEWVESANGAIAKAIEGVDQGDLNLFNEIIGSLLDGCQWFADSLLLIQGPIEELGYEVENNQEWLELQDQFVESIRCLMQAFENKDYTEIVDVLEFKLKSNFNKWLVLLKNQDKLINN